MNSAIRSPKNENRVFLICIALAFAIEFSVIYLSGVKFTFPFPHAAPAPETSTDVEVVTLPEEVPQLKSETAPAVPSAEETLAQDSSKGSTQKMLPEATHNVTVKGKPLSPTHGPVLIDSPSPAIPEYLKNKDLNTKVIIEFTVSASGEVSPKLLISSGNEELDQIALNTAKKWTFYPAENDHHTIASAVRLRILFEVK